MTLAEMITDIKAAGFDDMTDATALSLIDRAHKKICAREPFPFLEVKVNAAFTGGQITTPARLRAIFSLTNQTAGYPLRPVRLDVLQRNRPLQTDTGEAKWYYDLGGNFHVYPATSLADTYHVFGMQDPDTIDSTTDDALVLVPNRQHELIILDVISRAAIREDDPETASFYKGEFEDLYQRSREALWRKQYDRPDIIEDVYWEDDYDELMFL